MIKIAFDAGERSHVKLVQAIEGLAAGLLRLEKLTHSCERLNLKLFETAETRAQPRVLERGKC